MPSPTPTDPCPVKLYLRWGSAACDHEAGHGPDVDHAQASTGRTWTDEEAARSAEDLDDL